MQIQLKQQEIVAALRQYITTQGINIAGKSVEMTFTAGRKEDGLSVAIVIEDATIPGTEVGDQEEVKSAAPVLGLVKGPAVAAIATPETEKAKADPVAVAGDASTEGQPTTEVKASPSLFG